METFFMNSKNSKTSEPYKFKYDLTISLKYWHQLGMKHLTCLMDRIIY